MEILDMTSTSIRRCGSNAIWAHLGGLPLIV
jgi:hypothetical protein